MFLSPYTFTGEGNEPRRAPPGDVGEIPAEELLLNLSVVTDTGLTVYDGCPDRATFKGLSTSAEFTAALESAELPTPVITPLGEVHAAIVKPAVTT